MSDDENPFDALADEDSDRDGDPFDRLEPPDDDGEPSVDGDEPRPEDGDGWPDDRDEPRPEDGDGWPDDDEWPDDAASGDPFESATSPFRDAGVEAADPDEVWDRLTAEPDDAAATGGGEDVVAVSKHDHCENCEHFSAPPEVRCAHDGTEILEFVDVETVRVVDCPVVAERRELGDFDE